LSKGSLLQQRDKSFWIFCLVEVVMQKPSYKKNVALMRAKRVEKGGSPYSVRSFLHGFACAAFLSYFGFFFFFSISGHNLPVADRPALTPFVRPVEEIKTVIAENTPIIINNNAAPKAERVFPMESSIPIFKSPVSGWNFVGSEKGEALQGGPFISKDLVLGIAVNTDAKNFAIFAHSFRKFSPAGEAIIFVNAPVSDRYQRIAETTGVRIISFDIATLQPEFIRAYHPSSLRWILFAQLLRANDYVIQRAFSRVVMVDVRDTVFQSDPFVLIEGSGSAFSVFAEAAGSNIELCGWNSGWIKDCFGEKVFESVKANPIICSGVSMGTIDGVKDYVAKMSSVLLGQDPLSSTFPACERNGVDQGVHNVLVHTGALSNVTVRYEYDFPVVNLQAYPQLQVTPADPSVLTSEAGVKYALVHQYDRLSPLQTALAGQYVDWVNLQDPQAEWEKEPTCAMFTVSYEKDLFRGKCELGSHRVMSAASCCQVCQSKKKPLSGSVNTGDYPPETVCSSFTYLEGVCYLKSCRQGEVRASLNDPNQVIYVQPGAVSAYVSL